MTLLAKRLKLATLQTLSNILPIELLCSAEKCLSDLQTGKTLISVLQKQSDLGLHCLSMPFLQATRVQKCRTSTAYNYHQVL